MWMVALWIALGVVCACALLSAGILLFPPVWLMRRLTFSPAHVVFRLPTEERIVALTIDDGPDLESTAEILSVLRIHDVQATFFPWAETATKHPELLQRMVSLGHELGNHLLRDEQCWEIPLAKFSDELREADRILRVGGPVRWFRPPAGLATSAQYREVAMWGYRPALGSVYPYDSHLCWANFSMAFVLWNVRPGAIIVLHDGPGRGRRTVKVLRRILPTLKRRGYRIVSLSALVAAAEE